MRPRKRDPLRPRHSKAKIFDDQIIFPFLQFAVLRQHLNKLVILKLEIPITCWSGLGICTLGLLYNSPFHVKEFSALGEAFQSKVHEILLASHFIQLLSDWSQGEVSEVASCS